MKWLPLRYSLRQLGLNYEKELILEDKHMCMYHILRTQFAKFKLLINLGHHSTYGGLIKWTGSFSRPIANDLDPNQDALCPALIQLGNVTLKVQTSYVLFPVTPNAINKVYGNTECVSHGNGFVLACSFLCWGMEVLKYCRQRECQQQNVPGVINCFLSIIACNEMYNRCFKSMFTHAQNRPWQSKFR
jgi:hypothetical protein